MYLRPNLYLLLHLIVSAFAYSIPEPKVQIINPKGLRISIPHENGIELVAFHLNIDQAIALNDLGEFSDDFTKPTDGRWIFDIRERLIDAKSKVNYWIHVQYENGVYRKLGGSLPSGEPVDISDIKSDMSTSNMDSCEPSNTTVNRRTVCKGQLIFEDNFDNLNLTKWQREVRLPSDEDDADFVSFQARDENCYTDNGQLHIVPSLLNQIPGFESSIRSGTLDLGSQCTGVNDRSKECTRRAQFSQILPPVVSARIRTKNSFSFRYGRVEVRAKLPKGDWLFPQILLEPVENYYGITGYSSGQMRVAFIRGNEALQDRNGNDISGKRIAGGVVLSQGENLRDEFLKGSVQSSHLGDDFHTYTLTWTEELISVAADGNAYASFGGNFSILYNYLTNANSWRLGDLMAPFDREFYLALGVSAGGHSDFPNDSLNPVNRRRKPWNNADPKAELRFWNDHENWHRTWSGASAGLHVDYIRVYAL